MRKLVLLAIALGASSIPACTSDDGMIGLQGPCSASASLCVTLSVPDDYAKTPSKVIIGLFDKLPPEGPPNGIASIVDNPVIGPGLPLALEADHVTPVGDWFVYIVLYDAGGGKFQPVADVDYVGDSASKFHVGDGAVNLPDMAMSLYTN